MPENPLISVLMTAYNREKYISEAIESVLASSYKNFELIITDDCSTDKTVKIAKEYADSDNRIKIFINEKNIGQFANRNLAASFAKGTYIKFLDSDDQIVMNGLHVMVESMKKHPEAALGFCHTIGKTDKTLPFLIKSIDAYRQHFFEGGLLFTGPSGLIMKREIFSQLGGFEEFGMPSDNHLTLKFAGKYPVVAMDSSLFIWRIHDEQVFIINKNNYENILHNYKYINEISKKYSPLNDVENKLIRFNQKKIFYGNLFNLTFRKGKIGTATRLFFKSLKD